MGVIASDVIDLCSVFWRVSEVPGKGIHPGGVRDAFIQILALATELYSSALLEGARLLEGEEIYPEALAERCNFTCPSCLGSPVQANCAAVLRALEPLRHPAGP